VVDSAPKDGVSQPQETASLSLPQLNRLIETSFVWDESSACRRHAPGRLPEHGAGQLQQ
jgi:hypothetical protein